MLIKDLPRCPCKWCSDEYIDGEKPIEYLLECSGPFEDSREMHGLVLLVLGLQRKAEDETARVEGEGG
jgi:hypothetical protein